MLSGTLLPSYAAAAEGRPVVYLHGFASRTDIWRGAEVAAKEAGLDPILVGWEPGELRSARATATEVLLPAIEAGLAAHGHPPDASFDVVAHSMSGLLMRYLIEQANPELGDRVGALVMISTPHRGARTGVANWACGIWKDRGWRALGCELKPTADLVKSLGSTAPEGVATRYLSIGVESYEPFVPIPRWDGDGDGVALGHDKAVMTESAKLDGAPFAIWRAWGRRGDHFGVTCSAEVNAWARDFLVSGTIPQANPERIFGTNVCAGMPKKVWREARE